MANSNDMLALQADAEKAKHSLKSLDDLLAITKQFALGQLANMVQLQKAQKSAILDSYKVKKFHREHKEWEDRTRKQFVDSQVKAYNRKYAQISRLHSQTLGLEESLADLQNTVLLPQFKFSLQTIQQYEDGKYLEFVEKDANGEYPRTITTDQIFSLDPSSLRPHPTFLDFNKLVNIEFRSRIQLQIKYEVLLRIKATLAAKNSQWATRDSKLNDFITRDLPKVVDEVEKIKTSEYEDLKYYEEDYDIDGEGDDLDETGTEAINEGDEPYQKDASVEANVEPEQDEEHLEEEAEPAEAQNEGLEREASEPETEQEPEHEEAKAGEPEPSDELPEQIPSSAEDMILD